MPQKESKAIRVFLVDDHEIVLAGLRTLLGGDPSFDIVGQAATVQDAVEEAVRLRPDVVLMDVRLPDGSGVDACRQIRQACPQTRVLFLSAFGDPDGVVAAVAGQADGCLLKEVDSAALVRAIQSVAGGHAVIDRKLTGSILAQIGGRPLPPATGIDTLSRQEKRVLALVAEGKTNKEVAAALELSDKTVKNYLRRIFQKLRISRRAQAAAFFVGRPHR